MDFFCEPGTLDLRNTRTKKSHRTLSEAQRCQTSFDVCCVYLIQYHPIKLVLLVTLVQKLHTDQICHNWGHYGWQRFNPLKGSSCPERRYCLLWCQNQISFKPTTNAAQHHHSGVPANPVTCEKGFFGQRDLVHLNSDAHWMKMGVCGQSQNHAVSWLHFDSLTQPSPVAPVVSQKNRSQRCGGRPKVLCPRRRRKPGRLHSGPPTGKTTSDGAKTKQVFSS